jgi:Tol biopolymer transport system component
MYPNTWSPDGRHLVFQEYRPETGWDLLTLQVDALGRTVGQPHTLTATPFEESGAVISPDGGWVAYESDEVDALVQVYVRSFPDGGNKVRASTAGSRGPAWGRGGELYFWETSQQRPLVAHTRRDGSRLLVGPGQPIWAGPRPAAVARAIIGGGWSRFEVHPSGRRFLMLETAATSLEPSLTRPLIVLGGAEGLRARRPPPQ